MEREGLITGLRKRGINAISHYEPLHTSEAGKFFGKIIGTMNNTNSLASRIVRLPMWVGLSETELERIVDAINEILR